MIYDFLVEQGMNIILKLSDDAFEILDELLLLSEPQDYCCNVGDY